MFNWNHSLLQLGSTIFVTIPKVFLFLAQTKCSCSTPSAIVSRGQLCLSDTICCNNGSLLWLPDTICCNKGSELCLSDTIYRIKWSELCLSDTIYSNKWSHLCLSDTIGFYSRGQSGFSITAATITQVHHATLCHDKDRLHQPYTIHCYKSSHLHQSDIVYHYGITPLCLSEPICHYNRDLVPFPKKT